MTLANMLRVVDEMAQHNASEPPENSEPLDLENP
jgi:hypothetical protein